MMTRSSQSLAAIVERLRDAGLAIEADLVAAEVGRIRSIELAIEAVLADGAEPICFPARRVPGLRAHLDGMAHAAD
jgi:hypothetical protein